MLFIQLAKLYAKKGAVASRNRSLTNVSVISI